MVYFVKKVCNKNAGRMLALTLHYYIIVHITLRFLHPKTCHVRLTPKLTEILAEVLYSGRVVPFSQCRFQPLPFITQRQHTWDKRKDCK